MSKVCTTTQIWRTEWRRLLRISSKISGPLFAEGADMKPLEIDQLMVSDLLNLGFHIRGIKIDLDFSFSENKRKGVEDWDRSWAKEKQRGWVVNNEEDHYKWLTQAHISLKYPCSFLVYLGLSEKQVTLKSTDESQSSLWTSIFLDIPHIFTHTHILL